MKSSVSVGGFDDDVDAFKAVALADGPSVVIAESFVEVAGGPMGSGELIGMTSCLVRSGSVWV